MARTKGHGNPKWTREEVMLALSLYFEAGRKILSKTDQQVIALSVLLANLPFHESASRKENFRNPDGVAFKLQNLHYLDTGDGLGNTSRTDREIWHEYHEVPDKVSEIARQIRRAVDIVKAPDFPSDVESHDDFFEGRTLSEVHRRIERSALLRKRFLVHKTRIGPLECEICNQKSPFPDLEVSDAIFEVHHIIPISEIGETRIRLKDLALLCANCHRCVHRLIVITGEWLTVTECGALLGFESR